MVIKNVITDTLVSFDFDVVPIHKEHYFVNKESGPTYVIDSHPLPDRLLTVLWSMHYNNKCRHKWCKDEEHDLESLKSLDLQLLAPVGNHENLILEW